MKYDELKKDLEDTKGELVALKDVFKDSFVEIRNIILEHKSVSEETNIVTKNIEEKAADTQKESHTTKHAAVNIKENIKGFYEEAIKQHEKNAVQYQELKMVLEELRHERQINREQIDKNSDLVEESQRQVKEIADFIQSLKQVGTIKMWQEVITSVNDGKRFQDKFSFAAFFFGGIIVIVGLISAIIGAYEKLSSYFK